MTPASAGHEVHREHTVRALALLVAGCFFLENLDATIVTTAIPVISRSLGAPAASVGLVVTAYLLALATFLPLSAWCAARWGERAVMGTAIATFTLASFGCALAGTLPELLVLRVVQGIGGAMMVPVGRTVVLSRTRREDLVRTIAWLTWPGLVAPVIAPVLGGLVVTVTSWRVIFVVNVPLGAVALAAAMVLLPRRSTARPAPRPLDRLGVVLTGVGLAAAAWTAHLASLDDAGVGALLWALGSAAVVVVAVLHLRTARHPLIDLAPLRTPTLRAALLGSSLHWQVVGAVPFLLPLLLQQVFGWSPLASGALVLTVFGGNLAIKPFTTPLLRAWTFRTVLVVASLGVAASVGGLAVAGSGTPVVVLAVVCFVGGALRSLGFTAYNSLGLADVTSTDLPSANVLVVTFQQMSAAFAIATGSLALHVGAVLTGQDARAQFAPYAVAFALLAAIAVIVAALATRLPADAGALVRQGARSRR